MVKTNPRKEDAAATALETGSEGRVETYAPKIKGRSLRGPSAGKFQPLFPGYVFARFDLGLEDYTLVKRTAGVAYVLGYDGIPAIVPEEIIAAIRERLARGFGEPLYQFSPGERVIVAEGPFKDVEAIFDARLSPSGRSRVLIKILKRYVPVEIGVTSLVKIKGEVSGR